MAWLLALLAIPLLLAVIGWAGLRKPDVDVNANVPSVNPSATLTAPDATAPSVTAPAMNFGPLSIVRTANGFTLSGDLPNVETKTGLVESLKLAFGDGIGITDHLNIKAGVNAPDFAALGSILGAAVDIPDFDFDLNGDTLTLKGTAPSEESRTEVESAAKAAWPDMRIFNNIEVH